MKTLIINISILGLIGLVVCATAWGVATSTVSCTVTAKNITVSVTDGDVAYGNISLNATTSTVALPAESQTAQNTGNITENINIKSSAGVGTTTWNLATTTGVQDEYVHKFSTTTGSNWHTFATTSDYSTLITGIAQNATTSLDLWIQAPSSSGDYLPKTITVTAQAVAGS